jgi:hypothetical protein
MKTLTLLLIPATVICDAGLGDLSDAGLVYETAADARVHLADLISEMDAHDEQLIERVVSAAVTLDNPTAAQIAEAASHRCSPRYARNGHSVGVRASDLSAAHRAALDGGDEVLTADGAIIRARRSSNGRVYYTARLAEGYVWSDRGSYSKNPAPVRA